MSNDLTLLLFALAGMVSCFYIGTWVGGHKTTVFTWQRAKDLSPMAFAEFRRVMTAQLSLRTEVSAKPDAWDDPTVLVTTRSCSDDVREGYYETVVLRRPGKPNEVIETVQHHETENEARAAHKRTVAEWRLREGADA